MIRSLLKEKGYYFLSFKRGFPGWSKVLKQTIMSCSSSATRCPTAGVIGNLHSIPVRTEMSSCYRIVIFSSIFLLLCHFCSCSDILVTFLYLSCPNRDVHCHCSNLHHSLFCSHNSNPTDWAARASMN